MRNYFWTADTHFSHKNIIMHCNRPFENIHEMDETIIKNWNDKVGKQDIVFHLGDFAWKESLEYLKRLNGDIRIVLGNHDRDILKTEKFFAKHEIKNTYFQIIPAEYGVKIGGRDIIMSHYSMRSWHKSCHGSWHLYAHSHGCLAPYGKSWDVGVDNNNFTPLAFEEICETMQDLSFNGNRVRQ